MAKQPLQSHHEFSCGGAGRRSPRDRQAKLQETLCAGQRKLVV
jgi:hypothetical protein